MLSTYFFQGTVAFYLLATFLYLWTLIRRKQGSDRVSFWLAAAGFLSHSIALVFRMAEGGDQLLVGTAHEAVAFFAWALVLTFLLVEYRYRIQLLGSLILPLASLSIISMAVLPARDRPLSPGVQELWLVFHTTLTVLGIVFFTLAFVVGIIYLLQERLLKSRPLSVLYYKLPSLDLLDRLNQNSIFLGFPLLTLGMMSGILLNKFVENVYFTWDPKQILTLVIWLFYLAMLHGRITVGWRAKKAAYLAIIGFVGVIFTFVGVNHF